MVAEVAAAETVIPSPAGGVMVTSPSTPEVPRRVMSFVIVTFSTYVPASAV
ncbi:hypothetical protein V202x_23770 [Gimesia aquarii]|uniref:Uncharacterized protein n=1 Tax=Gimesia aquarii TaxID=2527964 RepID=A0A517WUR2_9PLAN|nr:hypothetical protein V202x_23770 [Gimesia aquarii]